MKVILTGASSFTGRWFALALAEAGHQVTATFTGQDAASYQSLRAARVNSVVAKCQSVFNCRFGDDLFIRLLNTGAFDLLCHHGADVTNYKSADFNVTSAVQSNCLRLNEVLSAFRINGGKALVLTGSVFEGGEGAGSNGLPHFSPYGLSKALTAQVVEYACHHAEVTFAKFVIPNPFGPYEDERFTSYLLRSWSRGEVACVRTPAYVRDNIHISLLALAYANFAQQAFQSGARQFNPSGYVESQGVFAERVANEMRARLGWRCALEIAEQASFDEPRVRINTTPMEVATLGWSEKLAWDHIATYYSAM